MIVVVAEKPSVAKDLARVMGAKEVNDGYISGNGYAFTYAFGHLVQLASPQLYGYHSWSIANLPIIPTQFKLVTKKNRAGGKEFDDPGVLKQLNVIKSLFEKADEIIVATDAGREGELIFRNIYYFLGRKIPFKRLWISSQTDKAIKHGFANLKEGSEYDSLYFSARSRSESDWLIGINSTQAITLAAGNRGLLSLGRVQTPTLAMICARYIENKNFKPIAFYRIEGEFEKDDIHFKASSARIDDKKLAEDSIKNLQAGALAVVTNLEAKEVKEPPPLLYDLTNLQQDANKKYGLTADETLNLAQSLYEKKVITYPRTGSRYIGEDVFEKMDELFQHLSNTAAENIAVLSRKLIGAKLNKRSVNDEKVTDHHALLITDEKPSYLSEKEQQLYNMIANRMIESFSEICIKEITTVFLNIEKLELIAKGTVIKQFGWRLSANEIEQDEEDKKTLESGESENNQLPILKINDQLAALKVSLLERFTKAKPIHTEASLLKAMETSGRDIEDEEMRQAMKDCGLGTPATRAATIQTLIQRQYIERDKKRLLPTEKGMLVYDLVKDLAIAKVELTGKWEQKLEEMRLNKVSYSVFMKHIKKFTTLITSELVQLKGTIKKETYTPQQTVEIACPKCSSGKMILYDKVAQCNRYARGCDYKIWRMFSKNIISEKDMKDLLENGKTVPLPFLKGNKAGENYLILKDLKISLPK